MYDEIDYDTLPGGIYDETGVQYNKTQQTVMIVQQMYGDDPESVTLDDAQMLELVLGWCARHGLTVS